MINTDKPIEEPQIAVVLMEKSTIQTIMLLLVELAPTNPSAIYLIQDITNHQPHPDQMFNRRILTNEEYAALVEPSPN